MSKTNSKTKWRLVPLTRLRVILGYLSSAGRRFRSRLPRVVWSRASQSSPQHVYSTGPLLVMMCSEAYGCERWRYPTLDDAVAGLAVLARYAYNQYLVDGVEREFRVIPEGANSETHGPAVHR